MNDSSSKMRSRSNVDEIQAWLVSRLQTVLGVDSRRIDLRERFQRHGLDSLKATGLVAELGAWLGRPLLPTVIWEHPTVEALARHLAGDASPSPAPGASPARRLDAEPIAIVGMACRFPEAPSPEAFWALLRDGVDAISEVPPGRWERDALYDPDPAAPGKMSTRWGGFLPEVDTFDAGFFGISPREAAQIDPQQRLALELSWEALEDAGIAPASLKDSRTGVFFGAMWMDYARLMGEARDAIVQHTATGQDLSIVPARVSYTLGLAGPSLLVNTACSSSLVAVHLACQSLLRGESRLALAGGVNLLLAPESTIAMSKFGAMAPDGRSKAFDARANGYVRGEGGGVVVLKRLSDALADGDQIVCVIRGSAVNNDGFSNGLTAPSPRAQEAVLREACAAAGVAPAEVQYVEAHGTGTMLGDPIEAGALGAVLGAGRAAEKALRIGSVKTNIGHLEAAAGIAGLIKVALSMRHRALPASLHYERPNPHIPFEALRVQVQATLSPWEGEDGRLLAGVSSFGFGGTNCHVVVEASAAEEPRLFVLTAESEEGLRARARAIAETLRAAEGPSLEAVCEASRREAPAAWRLAVVVRSRAELGRHLGAFAEGEALPGLAAGRAAERRPRVAMLFTGQGAQYAGMGRRLHVVQPAFRSAADRCFAGLASELDRPLPEVMWATPGTDDAALLNRTAYTQTALFTLEYALAELWRSWGLTPDVVMGHSVGELVAACVAGVLSRDDALRLVAARGRLMDALPAGGAMVAIAADEARVAAHVAPVSARAAIAAVNGASHVVVSGAEDVVASIADVFAAEGVKTRRLPVSHAFHSPLMAPMREDFRRVAESIAYQPPRLAVVTNLDGRRATAALARADHWVSHVEAPVRFADGLAALAAEDVDILVEVGPHSILLDLAKEVPGLVGAERITSMERGADDAAVVLEALGRLFVAGAAVRLDQGRDAHPPSTVEEAAAPHLVVLSARSDPALDAQAVRLREHLPAYPGQGLGDVAFSLATTRSALEHRLAVVARSREALGEGLAAAAQGQTPAGAVRGRALTGSAPKVVFVFPGQGSQWLGMGRQLLAEEPAFRDALAGCDRAIQAEAGFSVLAELGADEAASQLGRIDVVQPVLFALEVALAALWRSWGVEPDAVVGHSMGEVAAAHVAGALALEDAVAIICRRSRLLRRLSGQGEMALVELPRAEAEAALVGYEDRLSVAVSNSPRSTVLAGEPGALAQVLAKLEARGVFCRRVKVDVASHSPQVEPLRAELEAALAHLTPRESAAPMRSTVTGALVAGPELEAGYWADNLRQPVRFAEAVQALLESGHGLFVEMSPHPILTTAVEEIRRAAEQEGAAVGSLRRGQDERTALLEALGALWVQGHAVRWERLFPAGGRRVPLPTYPWQRERYWIEAPAPRATGLRAHGGGHPLLGEVQTLSTQTSTRLWETTLDLQRLPWLRDHQVQGAVVFPGAGYLEMALTSGAEVFEGSAFVLTDVELPEALAFTEGAVVPVQVVTTEDSPGRVRFQMARWMPSGGRGTFRAHARGVLRRVERVEGPPPLDLAALRNRLGTSTPAAEIYAALTAMGLEYGPAFQGLVELWRGEEEALGRVRLPEVAGAAAAYRLHPALLDACFQMVVAAFACDGGATPWVPVEASALRLLQRPSEELWCHARAVHHEKAGHDRRYADLCVTDRAGTVVAEISGLALQRLVAGARRRDEEEWFLELAWEPKAVLGARVTSGRFLLLGRDDGLGALLGAALGAAGHAVVHAPGGGTSTAGLDALLDRAFDGQPPTAVVHLGSLDGDAPGLDAASVERALEHGCDSVLATVQALAGMGYRDAPRLWLVTRGAQAIGRGDVAVAQAPLVGLGRVIALEHGELRCTCIDLDPARPSGELQALMAELLADDGEEEVTLRGAERHVARLMRRAPEAERREKVEPSRGRPFRLEMDAPGVLDRLALRAMERRAPGPGEVEIAVEAAGLNFLDVLLALGVMPNDVPGELGARMAFGAECAGRIVALGEGVNGLELGQPVLALGQAAFASHVTTSAALVLPRPAGLSATAAAAMPIAYLTAWYALDRVARLQAGERVLIHAATGGVGLAAVQWAQHVGAEVYATAGSPEKRAYLHALGVKYVSDSRSDQFVADVQAWTGGEGVDVVLNSLSGELIEKSFALLRDHGRFVELGKRDYYANSQLGLRPFLRNLSFSLVDLRGMILKQPVRVRALFEELLGLVVAGAFTPPPVTTLPIGRAVEAFHRMAQAKHLGKLVLTLDDPAVSIQVAAASEVSVRADGSYLVTGGLGGLGLSVAGWLAQKGAGHLVLVGRSGAASAAQQAAVAALEALGARVTVAKADVSDRAQVEQVLRAVAASGRPLRGVIHAAGVLDDGLLEQQTPARLRTVMGPKVLGALHLHELTREQPLDFFVLYASAVGLLGSPGQGNYAAANTFLDALAHQRRAEGLPALSIDWGAFSEVGLAAAQDNRGARLASRGMRSLTPDEGLSALERLLGSDRVQVGVVPLEVRQWVEFYPAAASSQRLSRLLAEQRATARKPAGDRELLDRLAAAEPGARATLLQGILRAQVAQVLRIPEGKLDVEAPLTSLGMDSLMGLELRNRIEVALGLTVPATLLWTYPTVAALSGNLAAQAFLMKEDELARPPDTVSEKTSVDEVAQLDEDGLLALVDEALAHKRRRKSSYDAT